MRRRITLEKKQAFLQRRGNEILLTSKILRICLWKTVHTMATGTTTEQVWSYNFHLHVTYLVF